MKFGVPQILFRWGMLLVTIVASPKSAIFNCSEDVKRKLPGFRLNIMIKDTRDAVCFSV